MDGLHGREATVGSLKDKHMPPDGIRAAAYHETAHGVVARALGLRVERLWIDGENEGGAGIETNQTHLCLVDRVAIWAAPIEAKSSS